MLSIVLGLSITWDTLVTNLTNFSYLLVRLRIGGWRIISSDGIVSGFVFNEFMLFAKATPITKIVKSILIARHMNFYENLCIDNRRYDITF